MTGEQHEEIAARLEALEGIIAMLVPFIARDGTPEQALLIANLRDEAAAMRTLNLHSAGIETYERVARLADDDAADLSDVPPGGP